MTPQQWLYAIASGLFALGMWLSLPRGANSGRKLGAVVAALSLALFLLLAPLGLQVEGGVRLTVEPLGKSGLLSLAVYLTMAVGAVASAICAVTFRSPVYCAIWFALTLLFTAGLFLFQGAQFLGLATVVVYAGAILVTFLFVLMLAQPQGEAPSDRISWEAFLSSCAGALLVGLLSAALTGVFSSDSVLVSSREIADIERKANILTPDHMARFGSELFGKHLIAVEVAGALLFIALVGAVAMVAHTKAGERPAYDSNGKGRP